MKPGDYGLSLIVGGVELTPLELAGIYATLAEDGAYRPLRLTAGEPGARPADLRRGRRVPDAPGAVAARPPGLPQAPRRRAAARHPLEDRHELRVPRCVGGRLGPVLHGGRVDRQRRQPAVDRSRRLRGRRPAAVRRPRGDRSHARPSQAQPDDLTEVEVCAYSGHVPGDALHRSREGARAGPRGADRDVPVSRHVRRQAVHRAADRR